MGSRRRQSISELLADVIDRDYKRVVQSTQKVITQQMTDGVIKRRLLDIRSEAVRLSQTGGKFGQNDAVLRVLIDDLDRVLKQQARAINNISGALQDSGIQASNKLTPRLAFGGATSQELANLGIAWNQPSLNALRSAADYTSSKAWQQALKLHSDNIIETVERTVLQGIARGRGPLFIARDLTNVVENLPLARAQNLMRTIQLTSYREASAVHEIANTRILQEKIRVAALDDRTCLACISLHGTRVPLGSRINDHHQGRCTGILVPKGHTVNIRSGSDWFNGLPPDRQELIAGTANMNALKSGRVQLQDFVGTYEDDVFGPMVSEMSLSGVLGDDAKQYYKRNFKGAS